MDKGHHNLYRANSFLMCFNSYESHIGRTCFCLLLEKSFLNENHDEKPQSSVLNDRKKKEAENESQFIDRYYCLESRSFEIDPWQIQDTHTMHLLMVR